MDSKIEAVVFDMDGVLFDTERLCLRVWKIVGERHGIEGIEEVFPQCIGRTTPDTKRIILEHYSDLDIDPLYEEIREEMQRIIAEEGLPKMPYADEVLKALKSMGVPLALASSSRYETVCRELKMAGFYDYFNAVIGGDMVESGKPSPDIYLKACELLGVEPTRAAAVEDSFNGVRAANAAGMFTIMVPDMVSPDVEMRQKANVIVTDIRGVLSVLNERA